MDFEVIQPGPGRLIRAMMDEINLIPIINSTVRWDETQWNLSPGELIAAMLISCFCRRQALYLTFRTPRANNPIIIFANFLAIA